LRRWEAYGVQLKEIVLGVTHRKLRVTDMELLSGNLILTELTLLCLVCPNQRLNRTFTPCNTDCRVDNCRLDSDTAWAF